MDREVAIKELTQWRDQMKSHGVPNYGKKLTALDLAIEALQEPIEEVDYCNNCPYISYNNEDCISRQQAIEALDRIGSVDTYADREYARGIFENLPPVTPTERTGEWIVEPPIKDFLGEGLTVQRVPKCSECGKHGNFYSNYCPNCGAKMAGGEHEID